MGGVTTNGRPCSLQTSPAETIGAPCPACGHTNLVHPGWHNPTVDACVICALLGEARADERERSAAAIEAEDHGDGSSAFQRGYGAGMRDAARIVRLQA